MAYINWEEKYSVGVNTIDVQHKRLIELINNLHAAMKEGRGKEILETVLDELVKYTVTHFGNEENLMAANGYAVKSGHKIEHDDFVQKVSSFQSDFNSGKAIITLEIMNFLKDWLVNHILVTDKKLGSFLSAKGIN